MLLSTVLALCAPLPAPADAFDAAEDRASDAFRQQTWDEAAELYGALLETAGSRADAGRRQGWATRRGKSLIKARRFEEAMTTLLEARQLAATTGRDQPDLDALLGFTHVQLGDMERAIESLESARRGWRREREEDEDVLDRVTLMRQHAHVDRLLQAAYLQSRNSAEAYRVTEEARGQALVAMLESRRPGLLDPGPWTFERAQQLAKDLSTTIISYSVLGSEERVIGNEPPDERMVLAYVTSAERTAVAGVRLDDTAATPLTDLVLGLRPQVLGEDEEATLATLTELYDLLIHPFVQFLPEEGGSLTILPHGPLHLVPFAALLDRGDDGNEEGTFLIERYEIRYGLSAAQLEASRRRSDVLAAGSATGGLIVGNPQPGDERLDLDPLPGAEGEAATIASMLDTEPWLRTKPRKSAVLSAVEEASVLHYASHAILGLDSRLDDLGQSEDGAPSGRDLGVNANPGGLLVGKGVRIGGVDASVALAQEKVARVPLAGGIVLADGVLFSSEIAGLDLDARLAVLSACSTGRGRITEDGAIGLRWAHLAAGVPGVVSSLWTVPDGPTAALMVAFYRRMLNGETASRALRTAMLEVRQEHPRVKDWAAFGITGIGGLTELLP